MTEYQQTQSPNPFYGSLFSQAPLWGTKPDEMSLYEIPVSVKVTYDGEKETSSLYEPDALNKRINTPLSWTAIMRWCASKATQAPAKS